MLKSGGEGNAALAFSNGGQWLRAFGHEWLAKTTMLTGKKTSEM